MAEFPLRGENPLGGFDPSLALRAEAVSFPHESVWSLVMLPLSTFTPPILYFSALPTSPSREAGAPKWRVTAAEFREQMCSLSFEVQRVWTLSSSERLLTASIIATVLDDILC